MKLLLTVKEAAEMIGLGRNAVAALCRRGELAFIPLRAPDGTVSRIHKRIPTAAIEDWIRRNSIRGDEQLRRVADGRRAA